MKIKLTTLFLILCVFSTYAQKEFTFNYALSYNDNNNEKTTFFINTDENYTLKEFKNNKTLYFMNSAFDYLSSKKNTKLISIKNLNPHTLLETNRFKLTKDGKKIKGKAYTFSGEVIKEIFFSKKGKNLAQSFLNPFELKTKATGIPYKIIFKNKETLLLSDINKTEKILNLELDKITKLSAIEKRMINFPIPTFDDKKHDFGEITQGDVVEHIFKFKNTGEKPYKIVSARASCGCTIPNYPKEEIQPGESGEIKVIFNSKGKLGENSKRITLKDNSAQGTTYLTISSNIKYDRSKATTSYTSSMKESKDKNIKSRTIIEYSYPKTSNPTINKFLLEYSSNIEKLKYEYKKNNIASAKKINSKVKQMSDKAFKLTSLLEGEEAKVVSDYLLIRNNELIQMFEISPNKTSEESNDVFSVKNNELKDFNIRKVTQYSYPKTSSESMNKWLFKYAYNIKKLKYEHKRNNPEEIKRIYSTIERMSTEAVRLMSSLNEKEAENVSDYLLIKNNELIKLFNKK